MATRKLRHGSNLLVTTASLIVILAVINVFASRHFVRWDLTEAREHTVSKVTRGILGNLENVINIKVYLSKDLPAELLLFERQLRDVLTDYQSFGKGNLRISYIAPDNNPQTQQDLMIQGVQPRPVAVLKRDRTEQVNVYNSLVIQFEDKHEVIGSLLEEGGGLVSDFEYLLTSRIFKVQRTGRQVVGWLTNAPDVKLSEDYRLMRDMVGKEWDIRDIRLDPPAKIADDIAVLVVVSPRPMTDAQLFEIDQYLMRGGKILALVDLYEQQMAGQQGLQSLILRPTNFTHLLEHYGLKVNSDIVLDRSCATVPTRSGFPQQYEFWVKILPLGLNKENPTVARLGSLVLPWTHSIDASTSIPQTVAMSSLARTSKVSVVRWGDRISPDPNPDAQPAQQSKTGKEHTVIAALSGTFPSFFHEATPYPSDAGSTIPSSARTREEDRKYVSPESQIVVVGNSMFLKDHFYRLARAGFNRRFDNDAFFLNSIEWLALGTGLGQIRSRQAAHRPIQAEIPDWKRTSFKVFGAFTMPVLVIVGGIVYNTVRRGRRRAIANRILGE